jgi:hypothetical protein
MSRRRSTLAALIAGALSLLPPAAVSFAVTPVASSPIESDEIAITRVVTIPRPPAEVFDFVAAEDVLPKVLTGYGPLPGVVATSANTGPWDRPGSERVVHLADGGSLREQVTAYRRPSYFSYRVWAFESAAINNLTSSGRGEWSFAEIPGGTRIQWTYAFRRRNFITGIPLFVVVHVLWRGYMDACLANTERLLRHHD